jgi:hypothetical protein
MACNTPPELNNEGTGREREWNMETQHGSLGGVQNKYSRELKILREHEGNMRGTRLHNTEAWVSCNTHPR